MLLLDTNVLVGVPQDDPQWANWSIGQLLAQANIHQLAINPIIYAEISRPTLFLAAKAYAQYRKRGGSKLQVQPDFFFGAHAAVEGWLVLIRDASRFRTYLPKLEVVAP